MRNRVILHTEALFFFVASMNVEDIVSLLKQLRRNKGITQHQMADTLGIGKMQYSNYETGKSQMTLKTFLDILGVLEVSVTDFFELSESLSEDELAYLQRIVDKLKQRKTLA